MDTNTTKSREEIIQEMTAQEIEDIIGMHDNGEDWYITEIFRNGFKGYDNFTDAELFEEYTAMLERNS